MGIIIIYFSLQWTEKAAEGREEGTGKGGQSSQVVRRTKKSAHTRCKKGKFTFVHKLTPLWYNILY